MAQGLKKMKPTGALGSHKAKKTHAKASSKRHAVKKGSEYKCVCGLSATDIGYAAKASKHPSGLTLTLHLSTQPPLHIDGLSRQQTRCSCPGTSRCGAWRWRSRYGRVIGDRLG